MKKTKDPTWDGVELTIWSATELSVGILIASLPPLRKQFDSLFRLILPTTFASRSKTPGNSIPLYGFSKQFSKPFSKAHQTGEHDDGSSERHILPGEAEGQIRKTVVHEITHVERDEDTKQHTKEV